MNNELINSDNEINNIFDNIKELVINSRNRVYATVNTEMLSLYWNIGKAIMEIQQGDERASYGETVLEKLSQKLTAEFGKGFSKRNLERMRKFYIYFPIATTVSSQLSWSHYLEILKVDEESKRNFYIKETINSRWSVRELQRQIGSLLYERLFGILLSTLKNKTVVKYTLPEDNKNIFSSSYKLHLPTEQELIDAVEEEKKNLELNYDIHFVFFKLSYISMYNWFDKKTFWSGYRESNSGHQVGSMAFYH